MTDAMGIDDSHCETYMDKSLLLGWTVIIFGQAVECGQEAGRRDGLVAWIC